MLLSLHIPFQDDPKTCHSITIFNSLLFSRWGTHPLRTMSLWWPWSVLRKRVTNWPNFTTTNTWTQRENGRQILITRPLADRTKWRSLNTAKRSVFWLLLFWSKCAHDSNLDFRDKAKTKCTKLKIFFEKQEFLEWELYSDQQGEKKGLSRQRIGIKGWEREVSLPAVSQIPFVQSQFYCCLGWDGSSRFFFFRSHSILFCLHSITYLSRRDFHSISSLIYHLQKECKNKWKSDLLHSTFCASQQ